MDLRPVQTLSRWSPAFVLDEENIPEWLDPKNPNDFEAYGIRVPKGLIYFDVIEYEGVRYGVLSPIAKNINWVLTDTDPGTSIFRESIARIARSIACDRIRDLVKVIMKPGVFDPDLPQVDEKFPTIGAPVVQECYGVLIRHPIYRAVPVKVIPVEHSAIVIPDKSLVEGLGGDFDGDLYGVLPAADPGLLKELDVPEVRESLTPEGGAQVQYDEEVEVLRGRLFSRRVGQPTLAAYQAWSELHGEDLRYSIEYWNVFIREIFDQKHTGVLSLNRARPVQGKGSKFYKYLYQPREEVTLREALDEFLGMLKEDADA